jgi:mannose-6-phosphate isomerase-like protein (cupin superfamily)
VLEVGKRYTSPVTGSWVEVIERGGGVTTAERSLAPGSGLSDPHLHQDFTETWEALSGQGRIELDGDEHEFRKGDRVVIELGTSHRNPWNTSTEALHIRAILDPSNDFLEAFMSAFGQHLVDGEAGRLTKTEEMPLLEILVIAEATKSRTYGASPPVPVQKVLLPFLAFFGRNVRGYRPRYD